MLLSLEDGVHFACDAALLTPEIGRQIDGFVNNLYRNDDVKVVIAGHSDNVGSEAYNSKLGQRRAASVARYLISK